MKRVFPVSINRLRSASQHSGLLRLVPLCPAHSRAPRANRFVPFLFGVALAWLLSACGLSGQSMITTLLDQKAEGYYESGVRDLQSGSRQLAIQDFTKAIQLDPTLSEAYEARAAVLFQTKDYAGAIKDCDAVIGTTHDDERVYLIKGASRYYLHDIKGALKPLNTAVSMNPDEPLARDIRGATLAESREWDDAIADFNKAIQLNPNDAMAYYGRAAAEFFLHEYEKSLSDVSDAIQVDNSLASAYGLRADVKTHLKDRAGAMADANTRIQLDVSDDKNYVSRDQGYVSRAGIETMWDDFQAASNDLKTAILINPTNSQIYLCRAVLEQKCRNFEAALADYTRGELNDPEAVRGANVYDAMGYTHAEMGQWQPALESFRKAMAYNSPPDYVHFEIFLIECRLGQAEQAKKELTAYIQTIPKAKAGDWTTSIAHYLAGALNETNFLAQATSTAKRPTDVAMQTGDAYYFVGMEHLLAGDKAGALERFTQCVKIGEDNSDDYMMAQSILGESVTNQPSAKSQSDVKN